MIALAFSLTAILKISRGCTIELFNVPLKTQVSLITTFFEFNNKMTKCYCVKSFIVGII